MKRRAVLMHGVNTMELRESEWRLHGSASYLCATLTSVNYVKNLAAKNHKFCGSDFTL